MELSVTQGDFVHIVATVDLNAGTGKILHVNRAKVATQSSAQNDYGVELRFHDAAGQELLSMMPQLLFESCDAEDETRAGLINQDVPYIPGMKEVVLLVNGQVQSRYVAGELLSTAEAGFDVGETAPQSPHRRQLSSHAMPEQEGITYTVQARPAGEAVWQTIAVGRSKPDMEVNVNQFPSAEKIDVRVVMTNGFEEEIVAEHRIVVGN